MPTSDPWLRRQNDALKLRGWAVTLELAGSRVRLRASMPPKPADPPGSPWSQQRISTGLEYPARASDAVELAETLGRSLERPTAGVPALSDTEAAIAKANRASERWSRCTKGRNWQQLSLALASMTDGIDAESAWFSVKRIKKAPHVEAP